MKISFDWIVRVLFLIVGLAELYFGWIGHFPSNLGSWVIGGLILCWLAVRLRSDLRKRVVPPEPQDLG